MKLKREAIDNVGCTVVERTVTELSHMDARMQVEVVETTYDGAIVFRIYGNHFHTKSIPPRPFVRKDDRKGKHNLSY